MIIKTKIIFDNKLTAQELSTYALIDLDTVGAISEHPDGKGQIYLFSINGDVIYVIEDSFNDICMKFIKSKAKDIYIGEN